MRDKLQCKPKYTGIIASVVTFICLIQSVVRPLYVDVDNYFISLVANKMFAGEAQDGYILHLHPFLCKLLEGVLFINESADCVLLVSALMLSVAIWAIAYVIASNAKSYYELLVYIVVFFAVVFVGDLFHDNYTRWAAFMTAAGVMVLLWDVHGRCYNRKHQCLAAFLLSCGMMWRDEAFLVFIPFVGLDFVITAARETKDVRISLVKLIGKICVIPVISIVVLTMTNIVFNQMEPYKKAIAYDSARVTVVDYAMKDWYDVCTQMESVTQNDYESAKRWILFDTERIDTEYLMEIGTIGETKAYELSLGGLIQMQKRVLSVFMDSQHFHYLAGILIIVLGISLVLRISWYCRTQVLLLFFGTDLIFLYFAYVGRAIERGFVPAIYGLLASLAILFLAEEREVCKGGGGVLLVLITILALGREITSENSFTNQSVWNTKAEIENKYEDQCLNDVLYIWNAGSYMNGPVQYFKEKGKLVSQDVLNHHMIEGAWIYGQFYFEQYLKLVGVDNPMAALLEKKNTFYVAEDCSYVSVYLQEHFDEKTTVEQVDEINGIPVWKFYVKD